MMFEDGQITQARRAAAAEKRVAELEAEVARLRAWIDRLKPVLCIAGFAPLVRELGAADAAGEEKT